MSDQMKADLEADNLDDTELFCPFCGVKSVKTERGDGDYYAGPAFVCTSCETEFFLP